MGQNDVDVKVKLTAMSSGLKEMANQLKELGGLKKESDMFAKAATNIAASIAVVNNIAGQGEVNTFKQYVASVEASFNKLSNIGAKLSKFRKILNEDMASIDLRDKNIDKNIVTIDEYKSMNSGQNVAIARQKVMSEQREMFPRLNKIDDTRLASYKSISKLTDAQVEKDYAAYVETKKAQIQTDLSNLEELRQAAFELYKLEKEVLKQELVEEKNKLRILKETHEKRLKGKTSQAEDWESPEEEDEARRIAESEKNKLRQDREIEAAKDVEIELRERANAQTQRDIELKQKVEKELRQNEALARKQFKEQVNLAKYNEKVGVMPSGLAPSNVALSSSQSQLDVAGVEKELNTRVQILKQLQAETKEKERQVGLVKNEEELQAKMLEYRQALEREEYGKASVKEARTVLNTVKEQTKEFKTQESIKAKRGAIGSPDLPISNEKLIDAAQQGNVEVVKQDLENRKQILEIAKLNVLEAQKELSLAKTKEEISKASINEQQAQVNQAHVEKDVALAKEQLKIAEKTAQVKKQEQEDAKKTDEIMKRAHKRITDLGGASEKIDFHRAQLEVARLNADLKEIPQHLRKAKAEELAKTLKAAGINAHQVGSGLQLAAAGSKKLEGQLKTSLKEFFSMDKLIQRITFVITATLSYKAFQMFIDGIKAAININIQFRDEMSKTFALLNNDAQLLGESIDYVSESTKKLAREQAKLKLETTVKDLAIKYRIDFKQATEGIYQIISAQISAANAPLVLESAMKLAVGGFSDLNSATLALVQTLNAFELEASEAEHVADVMFETTRLGIITTQQYADQMSKVASTASIFGISIEEVSAAISVMTRNGVKVDQAFTSLNQLLMTIANPTEEAKKTMDAYGVSLDMSKVRAEGLVNSLMSLGPILESEEAMTNIVKSRTGFKAMASLAQHSEEYIEDLISMYNSVGAAQEAADARLDTTASKMEELAFIAKDVGISIGKSLEGDVRNVLSFLVNHIDDAAKAIMTLIPVVRGLFISFIAFKIVPTLIGAIIRNIIKLNLIMKGSLIGTIGSIKLAFVSGFGLIKAKMAGMRVAAAKSAKAFQAAWASASMGLTFIITALISIVGWLENANKKSLKLDLAKAMNAETIESDVAKLQTNVERLDSKISSIQGFTKLIEQTEELEKGINKDNKALKTYEDSANQIITAVESLLNTEIKGANTKAKLSNAKVLLNKAEEESVYRLVRAQLALNAAEAKKSILSYGNEYINNEDMRPSSNIQRRFGFAQDTAGGLDAYMLSQIRGMSSLYSDILNYFPQKGESPHDIKRRIQYFENSLNSWNKIESELAQYYPKSSAKWKEEVDLWLANHELNEAKVREHLSGVLSTITSSTSREVEKALSDAEKGLKDAKNGGTKKTEVKISDRIKEFIDKYTDLFRQAGFEVEDRFNDKLSDISEQINKLVNDKNTLLPDKDTLNALESFGRSISIFPEVQTILKKKNRNFGDVMTNFSMIETLMKAIENRSEDIKKFAEEFSKLDDPELRLFGAELVEIYNNATYDLGISQEEYLENELIKLISSAKTPEEAIEISTRIAKEVYPEYITNLADAHFEELERALNDEKTPKSLQLYIKSLIDAKKKRVALGLKSMVSNYTNLLDNIEEHMNGFKELFDELQLRLGRYGVDTASLSSLIIALSTGDTKKAESILTQMQEKGNKEAQALLEKITESQKNVEKNQAIVNTLESSIKEKGEEKERLEAEKEIIRPSEPEIVQGIDYAAILDQKKAAESLKNTGAGAKKSTETFEQYLARALKNTPWEGWGKIRDAKTLDEKITEFYKVKNLVGKANVGKVPTKEVVIEAAKLSDEDQAKMDEINAKIIDIEADIRAYQVDLPRARESLQTAIDAAPKPKMSLDEMVKLLTESLPHLLPPNFKDWAPESQRSWLYEQGALRPGQRQIGEIGNLQEGELGEYLKEKVGATPMTIDEAWAIGEGKILELSTQLWARYWEQKITAAENARDKLIEVEENREKMMLENQNLSSEQQAKLKEKFEERRRKIQEESEKKIAEIRKKQALAELTMNFAKAIAEIWIKQLATKGTAGILESAGLTALLTGIYLKQRSIVEEQEFAHGGYTGRSNAPRDRTGERPAGIVHEGELVIDRKTMDKNFHQLISLYDALKSGKSFAQAVSQTRMANTAFMKRTPAMASFATGGYVGKQLQFNEPINVMVNFQGMRVLDDIDINIMAEQGGRKRRVIRG